MGVSKVLVRPGVNTEATQLLNESGWSFSQLIRFFQGILQKLGGWAKYIGTALHGTCRGMFAWEDLDSQSYLVCGTNSVLEVVFQSQLYDITPQLSVEDLTTPFTSIAGTNRMSVNDTSHGEEVGDTIDIITETSLDGKLVIGYADVVVVTDANNYIVETSTTFTSSVSGGITADYATTNTSPIVTVTLINHGRIAGEYYTINVSTMVGGLTLVGNYLVATVVDANNFTFNAGLAASSDDTGFENNGDIRINYLLHGGLVDATVLGGYGVGAYGTGGYGIGTVAAAQTPPRQWFFGNWGSFLIANYSPNGEIFVWDPAGGVEENPATEIVAAPTANSMFIAMPQRQIVALGADGDPLLIKWCDVDDYDQWTPSITNQAGSYRIPRGSVIIGGLQAPQAGMIWTDLGVWIMQYIQPPLIYGFTEIGTGCGLISARAMGILGAKVFWMSRNNFFIYEGSVSVLPCTVWDNIFFNLNDQQRDKITCAVNSSFNEISWYYPSLNSGEIDSYVKYNVSENVWDYGNLVRTAWIDKSVILNPAGVDENGYIQQHEVSNDADGAPLVSNAQTGWFKLTEGLLYIFVERMIPDFILSSGAEVTITVYTTDYPTSTPSSQVFSVNASTEYIIIRQRARLASIKIESSDLGSFWRMGELLYFGSPCGRR